MRPYSIATLLLVSFLSAGFSQKLDFSILLAPTGGVHSPRDFVIDNDGCIYVAGGAREGVPVTDNAFQKTYNGHSTWSGGDAYLMKLSPIGNLLYATYIGGKGSEESFRIALDNSGNIYVCGSTWSYDFPFTNNAYQKKKGGDADNFIIKFDKNFQLVASTYLGGDGFDYPTNINIVDDKIYLTGRTNSSDFPVTKNVIDTSYHSWQSPNPQWQDMIIDVSIAVLSINLDSVIYATYLGGKDRDEIISASFDNNHNLILTGLTWSDNYPTTSDCYDSKLDGGRDGFITILNPDLSKIIYSTYIGGNAIDNIAGPIEIDASDNLLLSGSTSSRDFPTTSDALYNNFIGGETDGFMMKFNLNTYKIIYSSYIGGKENDEIGYVAEINNQNYLLVGSSESTDYPITLDAFDQSFNGEFDIVLSILDKALSKIEYSTFIGGSKNDFRLRFQLIKDRLLFISLQNSSPDFPVTKKLVNFDNNEISTLLKISLKE